MLSCILGITSHLFIYLELPLDFFAGINSFSSLYIRFGELTLVMGFIGLFLTVKNNSKLKYLALIFVICSFAHFMFIEFGMMITYDLVSLLSLAVRLILFTAIILQFKNVEFDALTVKGYILIATMITYFIAFIYSSFLPACITCSNLSVSYLILPIFYIFLQIGIYVFFLELYREIFHYKNDHYINI